MDYYLVFLFVLKNFWRKFNIMESWDKEKVEQAKKKS